MILCKKVDEETFYMYIINLQLLYFTLIMGK